MNIWIEENVFTLFCIVCLGKDTRIYTRIITLSSQIFIFLRNI